MNKSLDTFLHFCGVRRLIAHRFWHPENFNSTAKNANRKERRGFGKCPGNLSRFRAATYRSIACGSDSSKCSRNVIVFITNAFKARFLSKRISKFGKRFPRAISLVFKRTWEWRWKKSDNRRNRILRYLDGRMDFPSSKVVSIVNAYTCLGYNARFIVTHVFVIQNTRQTCIKQNAFAKLYRIAFPYLESLRKSWVTYVLCVPRILCKSSYLCWIDKRIRKIFTLSSI